MEKLRARLASLADAVAFMATPAAWATTLRRCSEVHALRSELRMGVLSNEELAGVASDLIADLRRGQRFGHEAEVAAIAVVLRDRPGTLADQFLEELASLNIVEMPMSCRVARLIVRERRTMAASSCRVVAIADPMRVPPGVEEAQGPTRAYNKGLTWSNGNAEAVAQWQG